MSHTGKTLGLNEGGGLRKSAGTDSSSRSRDDAHMVVFLTGVVGAVCFGGAAWAFSSIEPDDYMDEEFHVPQTQAYCRGEYGRWDPKITTPPGLYVFAVAFARLVSVAKEVLAVAGLTTMTTTTTTTTTTTVAGIGKIEEECAVGVLRQVNWGFSLGTLLVMRALLLRRMAPGKALAHALLLWLYPVSLFFSFLFYTDPGATFFALLCYLLATGRPRGGSWGRRIGSSLVGGVSVLFRQTNAVWVAFTLAVCLLEDFTPSVVRDSDARGRSVVAAGAAHVAGGTGSAATARAGAGADGADSSPSSPRRPPSTTSTTRRRKTAQKRGPPPPPPPSSPSSGSNMGETAGGRPKKKITRGDGKGNGNGNSGGLDSAAHQQRLEGRACSSLPPALPLLLLLARAALADVLKGAPLLRGRAPLAVPVVLFATFVWGFNGGAVVIGDKDNHSPGGPPHFAQLAYLVAVGASLWGVVGDPEALLGRATRSGFAEWVRRTGVTGVAAIVAGVAVALWRYSLAHPFLLSDNRHYTFHVWRRLLSNVCVRVALAPAYVLCGWVVISRLLRRKPPLWVLTFAGAAAVVLVPSPLLEPRYLTIPVLLAHLESTERSWKSLLVGVVMCAAVNAVTIYIFLARPFAWYDCGLARFMW
ncbi:unnamed protein product [Pylaiella littoralis]